MKQANSGKSNTTMIVRPPLLQHHRASFFSTLWKKIPNATLHLVTLSLLLGLILPFTMILQHFLQLFNTPDSVLIFKLAKDAPHRALLYHLQVVNVELHLCSCFSHRVNVPIPPPLPLLADAGGRLCYLGRDHGGGRSRRRHCRRRRHRRRRHRRQRAAQRKRKC